MGGDDLKAVTGRIGAGASSSLLSSSASSISVNSVPFEDGATGDGSMMSKPTGAPACGTAIVTEVDDGAEAGAERCLAFSTAFRLIGAGDLLEIIALLCPGELGESEYGEKADISALGEVVIVLTAVIVAIETVH